METLTTQLIKPIDHLEHFNEVSQHQKKFWLFVYKSTSDLGQTALSELTKAAEATKTEMYFLDVAKVANVHPLLGIKTAPTVAEVANGQLLREAKGALSANEYAILLSGGAVRSTDPSQPVKHSVTVYSTPSCPWCNVLKDHLRKHGIAFRDVDVAANASEARKLVAATGQQGVPQTNIDGNWIVGFDKAKINRLLEINQN